LRDVQNNTTLISVKHLHQTKRDNIRAMIDKIREFENLMSIKHIDFGLCRTKEHELLKCKESLPNALSLLNDRFFAFLIAVRKGSEIELDIGEVIYNVQNEIHGYQDLIIEYQDDQIDQYAKGTKKRSALIQKNWALAQQYFAEEIPRHRTLQSARKAAANRAGIKVTDRRLIEMLPVEK